MGMTWNSRVHSLLLLGSALASLPPLIKAAFTTTLCTSQCCVSSNSGSCNFCRVPKDEFDKAKKKILDLESKLMQTARVERQSHNLTPRPQWCELRGSVRYTSSTATQAAEVCMKNEELQQTISSLRSELAYAEVALAEVKLLQLKHIPLTEHSEKSYISVHLQRINSAESECWESITK
jgi:hypothetical protein